MLHHMCGEQDGRAVGGEASDHLLQTLLVHRVEAGKGFVQDHELGAMHHRGDQLDLLCHPLGQVLHLLFLGGAEALLLQHVAGARLALGRRQALQRAEKGDGLDRRHLLIEAAFLGKKADAVAHLPTIGRTQDVDAAAAGGLQPQDHADGGGLARPVRAQEAADRSLGHGKTEIAHGVKIAVALAYALQRQRRRHAVFPPCPCAGA